MEPALFIALRRDVDVDEKSIMEHLPRAICHLQFPKCSGAVLQMGAQLSHGYAFKG